ncbi:MAG: hypothetical protein O2913_12210 [Chloroflexi bacterium]|nr:hypothetical protein [Chloroflexota bacterium]
MALSLDVLGDGLLVSEELRADAEEWRSKLDQRKGAQLAEPRIERNRYLLDHGAEDTAWVALIPSQQSTSTGSRFLKHPAVLNLLQQVFSSTPDELAAAPLEDQLPTQFDDDRDLPDPADSGRLKIPEDDEIKARPLQAITEDANLRSHIRALEAAGAGDGWVDCLLQVLRAAAAGELSVDVEDLTETDSPKHNSAIKLVVEITRQGPEDARRQACSGLVNLMTWFERDHFMVGLWDAGLDYIKTETVDDLTLFKGYTAERIGQDPFDSVRLVENVLDDCDGFEAYRRAVDAYCDGTLFGDLPALRRMDVQSFLRRVMTWFGEHMDEESLVLAFETYVRFLCETAMPEQLEELVQVCQSVGDRRSLKVNSSLLVAHALHALNGPQGGISSAIEYLVAARRNLPLDYEGRDLLCEEARLLARHDPALTALLGDCGVTTEQPSAPRASVSGRVLVVGGQPRFKERGLRAIRQAFPKVDFEWLDSNEAGRSGRMRTLITDGGREVLLYTWVLSHSAEQAARAAAVGANRHWARVKMPALAAVLREVPTVLGAA